MIIIKILLTVCRYLAAAVLWSIIISIGTWLIATKIVVLRFEFFEYIYYFGLGVLGWYPISYILKN